MTRFEIEEIDEEEDNDLQMVSGCMNVEDSRD